MTLSGLQKSRKAGYGTRLLGYEDACRLAAASRALQAEVLPEHVFVRATRGAEPLGSPESNSATSLTLEDRTAEVGRTLPEVTVCT